MTTLIGIKTNAGLESIVLAADMQLSEYEGKEIVSKRPIVKFQIGEEWVMGNDGEDSRDLLRFYGLLKGYKNYGSSTKRANKIIERAIRKEIFLEVLKLNAESRRKGVYFGDIPCFLFAVNKPKLGLWWLDEYGNFKGPNDNSDFDYICLGSGGEKADAYIKSLLIEEKIERNNIRTGTAIDVVRGAITAAEKEAFTGLGYSLIVLTEKEIRDWTKEIKKEIAETEKRKLASIRAYYLSIEQKMENPQADLTHTSPSL